MFYCLLPAKTPNCISVVSRETERANPGEERFLVQLHFRSIVTRSAMPYFNDAHCFGMTIIISCQQASQDNVSEVF